MDEINQIWPQWRTEELIGSGAFGKVYKVKREAMGNISYSAVKVMHIPQDQSEVKDLQNSGMDFASIHAYFEDMIKNLLNEIQIMESLKSANNIVGIEDYQVIPHEGVIGWDIYIRMELLTDLGTYLQSHTISEQEVLSLGIDICRALTACNRVNIIHRDIKIDNVFINQFGSFKLGDFGISKQLEKTRSAVSQKGTNMYMAPEVFKGESYNHTVDIYSLGILMYRLLNNGRFPFMPPASQPLRFEDTQNAMAERLAGKVIVPPVAASKEVGDIIVKACAYQSADRYQSAEKMLQDINICMQMKGYAKDVVLQQVQPVINPTPVDEGTSAAFTAQPVVERVVSEPVSATPIDEGTSVAFTAQPVAGNVASAQTEMDRVSETLVAQKEMAAALENEKTTGAFSGQPIDSDSFKPNLRPNPKAFSLPSSLQPDSKKFSEYSSKGGVKSTEDMRVRKAKASRGKKKWILGVVIIAILAIGGAGVAGYLYMNQDDSGLAKEYSTLDKLKISMRMPKGWEVDDNKDTLWASITEGEVEKEISLTMDYYYGAVKDYGSHATVGADAEFLAADGAEDAYAEVKKCGLVAGYLASGKEIENQIQESAIYEINGRKYYYLQYYVDNVYLAFYYTVQDHVEIQYRLRIEGAELTEADRELFDNVMRTVEMDTDAVKYSELKAEDYIEDIYALSEEKTINSDIGIGINMPAACKVENSESQITGNFEGNSYSENIGFFIGNEPYKITVKLEENSSTENLLNGINENIANYLLNRQEQDYGQTIATNGYKDIGDMRYYYIGSMDTAGRYFSYYTMYQGKVLSVMYSKEDSSWEIDNDAKKMLQNMLKEAEFDY